MSEPIITFNNRTLRVEKDGWHMEVMVLASGTQIAVACSGTGDGTHELIVRPDTANRVFISSRASEKESTDGETTVTSDPKPDKRDSDRSKRTR